MASFYGNDIFPQFCLFDIETSGKIFLAELKILALLSQKVVVSVISSVAELAARGNINRDLIPALVLNVNKH